MENEDLIKKQIRTNKIKIILDVVVIVLFIFIIYYGVKNIELFKILGQDVCRLCQEKTGTTCFRIQP
jgi:hypothetical protein